MDSGKDGAVLGPASRRAVLVGAGAAAVAVLAGCQAYDSNAPVDAGGDPPEDDPSGGAAAALTQTFTAVCTHQGCLVSEVKGGTINCPCHGSAFKVADGSVANGPANKPLRAIDITVEGSDIKLA